MEKVTATAGVRTSEKVLYKSKGNIYDRKMNSLAGGQKAYYLIINPRDFDKTQIEYISKISGIDLIYITEKLKYETPFTVISYEKPKNISGVFSFEGYTRYEQNMVAQHIIGYLDNDGVKGLSGVEKAYDDFLSKYESTSYYTYKSDAVNSIISEQDINIKINNGSKNGVVLTIDKNLSAFAENTLKRHCTDGCVIVMNCNDGEIYALSSVPSFDNKKISDYKNNELVNNALVNQTVGSVFKIIVSATALKNELEDFQYECTGGIEVSGRVFSCQNGHAHGLQSLSDAFANSCNCYFIAIGQLLGFDKLIDMAKLFGMDSSIKIAKDLYSYSGVIPQESGTLALANMSIGQGELLLSPLNVTRMTAAVCNGGYLINPTVYKGIYLDDKMVYESEYEYKSKILTKQIADKLKQLCIECVENGTGKSAKPKKSGAGGKTASAQTGRYDENGKEILNNYFTGFYPAENPEYVITVFAKNGESGSVTCAPVFKEICDYIEQNC